MQRLPTALLIRPDMDFLLLCAPFHQKTAFFLTVRNLLCNFAVLLSVLRGAQALSELVVAHVNFRRCESPLLVLADTAAMAAPPRAGSRVPDYR